MDKKQPNIRKNKHRRNIHPHEKRPCEIQPHGTPSDISPQDIDLRVDPATAYTPLLLTAAISTRLGIDANRIAHTRIIRRSIDARQKKVMVNLTVRTWIDIPPNPVEAQLRVDKLPPLPKGAPTAIVVGAGPAGLFAAMTLIERGIKPIILERGKDVDSRRRDMAAISKTGTVDPDSNYCFGEGGAGAYSDGKLYTRSKKRGPVGKVLNTLYANGAPEDILIDAHPHIGTDKLPVVIKNIRKEIERCGGEVCFMTRVEDLILEESNVEKRVKGVVTADGSVYNGPVILATGHSARDIYHMLLRRGISIEPKGIAVGVRLEHPQTLIDRLRYHDKNGRGKYLPPAEYTMLTRVDDRAVYSFCMCPGGFIIPAASEPGQLVVNGMSPSNRGTKWANSGMVVEVLPEDIPTVSGGEEALKMMQFQEEIEKRFFEDGDGSQNAPAQRMDDFVNSRPSKDLPSTSYAPGIHSSRIDRLLPQRIAYRLQKGFEEFERKNRGFLTHEAILIGAETRTSSPVRVTRDPVTLQHVVFSGLYPTGEGAGYAGGIVSAAIDGIRAAEALSDNLTSSKVTD